MATANYDPHLGAGPSEDYDILLDDSDSGSVLSDDSVLPDYEDDEEDENTEPAKTLYEACSKNNLKSLRQILERGVTKDEAMELDINSRNGLMVSVAKGFIDMVTLLHTCPFIDINHQDNDGNTALMIAAQAGFNGILNHIINYFPGVDTEVRDPRGFTALIKAGLQGRTECVSALIMHGADINATDHVHERGLKDWILRTGGFETLQIIRRLHAHPVAVQFCESYIPEWPELKHLVAKATASKTASQKLRQRLKDCLSFSLPRDPQDNGVLDHMVKMTTSVHSPLIASGCRPLCPNSPPEIGKRRFAVPELLARHSSKELEESTVSHSNGSVTSASPTVASATSISLTSCCQNSERSGGWSFLPRCMGHGNSIFPSGCVPKIEVTRSSEPTPKKEKKTKKQRGYLEPPVWKYKEARAEKKKEKKKEKEKEQQKKSKGSKRSTSKK